MTVQWISSSGSRTTVAPAAIKPVKMGATPVAALNQGIGDIAKQVAGLTRKKVAKWPDLTVGTGNDEALLSYARCHATVLNQYEINADWPGYAQEALEKAHPGTVAMFVNGCGADQNPLPRREVWLAQRYGEILAKAVDLVLEGKMRPIAGPIRARYQTVDLLLQEPPTRAEFEKRAKGDDQSLQNHARLMLHYLEKDGKLWDRYPYPVQVWQFGGDLTFISLAGEVVADYALRLKQEHGWDDTWVSGYNNDVFAYIPSLRILHEGGYEGGGAMIGYGQPAPFRASVEETIVETVAELAGSANE